MARAEEAAREDGLEEEFVFVRRRRDGERFWEGEERMVVMPE